MIFLVDKYKHLSGDISVRNTDLVFVYFLNCLFNDSIVLVVYIIFLIDSENWKDGQMAFQFSSQVLNAPIYYLSFFISLFEVRYNPVFSFLEVYIFFKSLQNSFKSL